MTCIWCWTTWPPARTRCTHGRQTPIEGDAMPRVDDSQQAPADDPAARLDLFRRLREGDPEARRQVEWEWLGTVLRLASCPRKRVARAAQKLLRGVPRAAIEQHLRERKEGTDQAQTAAPEQAAL